MINSSEIARSLTTRYIFNISKNYLIWFSIDPEQGLGLENERYLFEYRKNNPGFQLSLVYSADCLSTKSILKLEDLCSQLQIRLVKFEDIEKHLREPNDKTLFAIAKAEIDHAKYFSEEGGNMAGAADVARQMRYLIETYGNYQDFDVKTQLSKLNTDYLELKGPVLLTTGVVEVSDSAYQVYSNSDFLAFSLDKNLRDLSPEALRGLKACQQEIIAHYTGPFVFESLLQGKSVNDFTEKYPELPAVLADFYAKYPGNRTVFNLRKYLKSLPASVLDAERSETLVSYFLRLSVISMSGPGNTLLYFKSFFPAGQTQAPIFILKKDLKKWQPFINMVVASGIGFYDPIYEAIKTDNSFFSAVEKVVREQKACIASPGQLSHQSWTQAGRAAKLEREHNLYKNAENILGFWRRHSVGKEHVIERHLAIRIKKICAVETILDAISDKKYSLALRKACCGLQLSVVKLLLESGIRLEINELTSKNQTALDLARSAKGDRLIKAKIVELIVDAGGKTAQALLSKPLAPK
ncbi:MAG: glycosyltransferase family 88 protein [Gammaproteobacteria bacterium]